MYQSIIGWDQLRLALHYTLCNTQYKHRIKQIQLKLPYTILHFLYTHVPTHPDTQTHCTHVVHVKGVLHTRARTHACTHTLLLLLLLLTSCTSSSRSCESIKLICCPSSSSPGIGRCTPLDYIHTNNKYFSLEESS